MTTREYIGRTLRASVHVNKFPQMLELMALAALIPGLTEFSKFLITRESGRLWHSYAAHREV